MRAGTSNDMHPLLLRLLDRVVSSGDITFVDADGRPWRFGDGTGAPVRVRLADRHLERELALDPELAAGRAYMEGRLLIEEGSAGSFLDLMMRNVAATEFPAYSRTFAATRRLTRRLQQYNPLSSARRNVEHHYDIDPRIYDLFLDTDRQYSCAYFNGDIGLDEAQLAKKRHIAAKLDLKPGHKVLDIGSGWGGLAHYLAEVAEVDVTGITLSQQQLAYSRSRAMRSRRPDRLRFEPCDYREVQGRFDRIVSVGMFEHVGINHYGTFFKQLGKLLDENGVVLLHTIGRAEPPAATNPFIAHYIFPGGYIPALSEVVAEIERSNLIIADVETLRGHYAETLRHWRERFLAARQEVIAIAGEPFARMWEFYLAGAEAAFRHWRLVVYQLQLAKRVDALPVTRDYIAANEAELRRREVGRGIAPGPPEGLPDHPAARVRADSAFAKGSSSCLSRGVHYGDDAGMTGTGPGGPPAPGRRLV